MSTVKCIHCDKVSEDWLADLHECLWKVWPEGGVPRFEWRGASAAEAARSYAFNGGMGRGHPLCDAPSTELRLYVQRKNSDVVTPVIVRGRWQPIYEAYPQSPIYTAKKLL